MLYLILYILININICEGDGGQFTAVSEEFTSQESFQSRKDEEISSKIKFHRVPDSTGCLHVTGYWPDICRLKYETTLQILCKTIQ